MGQGFAYARENNGTREVVIKDWQRYCMSAFSRYLAFSGNLLKEGSPDQVGGMTQGLGILEFLF